MTSPDSVAIVSGGLDSTTLVYDMITTGYTPHLLSFDYGQRHKKELQYAAITARNLGLRHDIVDLSGLTHLISNSALTSDHKHAEGNDIIEVPEGHYAEENMKSTVVPNRNMIMLSIAAGIAVNNNYKTVGMGVHGGDHFIYPDCRPEFIFAAGQAILAGNKGHHNFFTDEQLPEPMRAMGFMSSAKPIYTPFLHGSKADIVFRALELGVPLHLTWSCYKGGESHCGRCGTCVERLEAIDEAIKRLNQLSSNDYSNIAIASGYMPGEFWDNTVYEDGEFWKTQVRK